MIVGKISGTSDDTTRVPFVYGVVIYIASSKCKLKNCSFQNNIGSSAFSIAGFMYRGNAIFASKSVISVEKCNFTNNLLEQFGSRFANIHDISGVCAFVCAKANISFSDCVFKNNTSLTNANVSVSGVYAYGAGVYILEDCFSELKKCDFINNTCYVIGNNKIGSVSGCAIRSSGLVDCSFCTFTNNTGYYTAESDRVRGGAIEIRVGNINKCCFSENTAKKGGHIYFSQSSIKISYIKINECSFMTSHNNNNYMQSLIFFDAQKNLSTVNEFKNNVITFNNDNNLLVFDGQIKSYGDYYDYFNYVFIETKLKFSFENNCISPFDDINYINESLNILDESDQNVTFDDIFSFMCTKPINKCPFYKKIEYTSFVDQSDPNDNNNILTPILSVVDSDESSLFDKNVKERKKITNIAKIILLSSICCFEVVLIILIIVIIVIVLKRVRDQEINEPLINEPL